MKLHILKGFEKAYLHHFEQYNLGDDKEIAYKKWWKCRHISYIR
jgi:hypothetical protein